MHTDITHEAARARADEGIARVAAKAESVHEGWVERAAEAVRWYARGHAGEFTIERARGAVADRVPEPHDLRAWGAVTQMAVRRRYIERVPGRYEPAVSSNCSPKPMYRRGAAA